MHVQVLSSGSEGNSTLVRAGETNLLVDAGLLKAGMEERLDAARLAPGSIDHVLVTHGHLDHARSAGAIARRDKALLHCAENIMLHPAARRARKVSALRIGGTFGLAGLLGRDPVQVTSVPLPHDCDPTVAFRIEQSGRVAVILTDLGRPDDDVARALRDPHVLLLEFNYDPTMMESGPYDFALRRRITGGRGHLSNAQGADMLAKLAGPNLHTLLVAHVSQKTNRQELALEAATKRLEELGLSHVTVRVASQHEIGENVAV